MIRETLILSAKELRNMSFYQTVREYELELKSMIANRNRIPTKKGDYGNLMEIEQSQSMQ